MNHYNYLFTEEGFRCSREKMSKVEWYRHLSSIPESFRKIQAEGLQPRRPLEALPPSLVSKALKPEGGEIVCLYPVANRILQIRPPRPSPLFMIAVSGADLPRRVSIDWSFGNLWSLFDELVANEGQSPIDALAEVSARYGSLACYDPLPPENLRVRTRDCSEQNYVQWPYISEVSHHDLHEEPSGDF